MMTLPPAVQNYIEAFNVGDFGQLFAQFTPDAIIHGVLGTFSLEEVAAVWRELHEGMALHLDPRACVVDGNSVAVRFVETGCFRGHFRGLAEHAPTHRTYRINAIEWFQLSDGMIRERWGGRDSASIYAQVLDDR
ncbi:ester cyclase [Sphingomonas xanthus]|uniref:Nuclear transport factor 2 family protein n=1 Tax=Sphingomonas xanthus TaxID=2594473 RepID=A0A516IST3_9SPHN|nr:nuclear transport factor 2 family protein [Sphingomonas xanthus]QDP19947.1 nuclear transport factor 2 family protein [Sphingomonas xanthus]